MLPYSRYFTAYTLKMFKNFIPFIDANVDKILILHMLGNECRDIANDVEMSDFEKQKNASEIVNEFSQEIIALPSSIKILVSMLLFRFDNEKKIGMSNPENLRQFMNAKLQLALAGKSNVKLVNHDNIFNNKKFYEDKIHLSKDGFHKMFENWSKYLGSS